MAHVIQFGKLKIILINRNLVQTNVTKQRELPLILLRRLQVLLLNDLYLGLSCEVVNLLHYLGCEKAAGWIRKCRMYSSIIVARVNNIFSILSLLLLIAVDVPIIYTTLLTCTSMSYPLLNQLENFACVGLISEHHEWFQQHFVIEFFLNSSLRLFVIVILLKFSIN